MERRAVKYYYAYGKDSYGLPIVWHKFTTDIDSIDPEAMFVTHFWTEYPSKLWRYVAEYAKNRPQEYISIENERQSKDYFGGIEITDDPYFDRFDICEAYYLIEVDYNVSGVLQERASNQRRKMSTGFQLHRMGFKPSPLLSYESLSDNGKDIYDRIERQINQE